MEGDVMIGGRNSIFEPRSDEHFEEEVESKETTDPKEILISEITDPKEVLISEINNMQKTLRDLVEKAGRVNGDVRRLESENEVNV